MPTNLQAVRLLAILLLLAAPRAGGDEVVLRGGSRIRGVVLERDARGLRLVLPGGTELSLAAKDVARVVPDPDAPPAGDWIRFHDRGDQGSALEVALVHLVPKEGAGPRVDLLSAVHVAEPSYWREVRRILEGADVVLFELVMPEGASVREVLAARREREGELGRFQRKIARWFGLRHQLDAVDYGSPHFVHADAVVRRPGAGEEGRAARDGQRDETREAIRSIRFMLAFAEPMLERAMGDDSPDAAENRILMKRMIARTLGKFGERAALIFGGKLSEVVLDRRNAIVVKRLREIPDGARSVVIFYGGGHMPDIEKRLLATGDYRRAGGRWLRAWEIPPTPRRE